MASHRPLKPVRSTSSKVFFYSLSEQLRHIPNPNQNEGLVYFPTPSHLPLSGIFPVLPILPAPNSWFVPKPYIRHSFEIYLGLRIFHRYTHAMGLKIGRTHLFNELGVNDPPLYRQNFPLPVINLGKSLNLY